MNVTKELLEKIGVVSMTLSNGANDYVCFLKKINGTALFFSLLSSPEFYGRISLKVSLKTGDSIKNCAVGFTVSETGEDYCVGNIDRISDENLLTLFEKLASLEYQDEKYGRRKEARIPIGKAHCERFGLSTPEQTLFVKGIRLIQPCAIVDASIHGVCVITRVSSPDFNKIENFNIKFSFKNPDETVIVQAHKVHERLKRTDKSVFATLSCQLLEPINYSWKARVINLIESLS